MKKIIAIIEKDSTGLFQISSENPINGYYLAGCGNSVEEAKADFNECWEEAKEMMTESGIDVEKANYEIIFRYDLEAFFDYFNWINVTQLARMAGVNESKMRQYKAGLAFASDRTTQKILSTVKRIGAELQAAEI